MTVVVVVPFHHAADPARRDIMSRQFHHMALMPDVVTIGVGSERHLSEELFTEHHKISEYREFEQDWETVPAHGSDGLRAKFNAGIRAARFYEPDHVFICGSDDFVPAEFFTPSDADLVGLARGESGGIYFWDYGTEEAWWWAGFRHLRFIGGAQGFSTRLLEMLDWSPYQFAYDEVGLEQFVTRTGLTLEARSGMPSWSPKSAMTLNTLDAVKNAHSPERVDDETFREFKAYWDALA